MWIFMNDSMLSIVEDHTDRTGNTLLVRARIQGDIESVFPNAKVRKGEGTDYLYRASINRSEVAMAILNRVTEIDYGNFKGSVKDDDRERAYMNVWIKMIDYQEEKEGIDSNAF